MLGIVVDDPEQNGKLADRLEVAFPILSDSSLATIRAYGIEHVGKDISLPATFIVDAAGKIIFSHVGESTRDRPAVDDLLAAL